MIDALTDPNRCILSPGEMARLWVMPRSRRHVRNDRCGCLSRSCLNPGSVRSLPTVVPSLKSYRLHGATESLLRLVLVGGIQRVAGGKVAV